MKNHPLHELLKQCRDEAKFSQDELADKLSVDRTYISKVENDRIDPSYAFVKRWGRVTGRSALLGIDIADESEVDFKVRMKDKLFVMSVKESFQIYGARI